jgi:hypothetical protein
VFWVDGLGPKGCWFDQPEQDEAAAAGVGGLGGMRPSAAAASRGVAGAGVGHSSFADQVRGDSKQPGCIAKALTWAVAYAERAGLAGFQTPAGSSMFYDSHFSAGMPLRRLASGLACDGSSLLPQPGCSYICQCMHALHGHPSSY